MKIIHHATTRLCVPMRSQIVANVCSEMAYKKFLNRGSPRGENGRTEVTIAAPTSPNSRKEPGSGILLTKGRTEFIQTLQGTVGTRLYDAIVHPFHIHEGPDFMDEIEY